LRRASVNSFGFGGSNAHCIVEDAYHFLTARTLIGNHSSVRDPPVLELRNGTLSEHANGAMNGTKNGILNGHGHQHSSPKLLVWSAADEGGLNRLFDIYDAHFKKVLGASYIPSYYLDDITYTLGQRRSVLPWKSFAIADAPSSLQDYKSLVSKPVRSGKSLGIAFVFTGQGAQYSGMGAQLLKFPVFSRTFEMIDAIFRSLGAKWSLFGEIEASKKYLN